MVRPITGMSVIVTGGARGVGRATVERLAGMGASVAVGDIDADLAASVAGQLGDRVTSARLDVADAASWREFLSAVDHLGPWDALVNNAGIMPLGPLLEESDEVTRSVFDVNVFGAINGTKAVAPGMTARGRGHIINVASAVGRMAVAHGASYSASKSALIGLSEAMRVELAPQGVDVTVVLPTRVLTEMSAGVPDAGGLKPVTADDVAVAIVGALRRPAAEIWVPKWLQGPTKFMLSLPRWFQDLVNRFSHATDVLLHADPDARAAYDERVRRSRSR